MSQITTHILDTALGKPAAGVAIRLLQKVDDDWIVVASGETNTEDRSGLR